MIDTEINHTGSIVLINNNVKALSIVRLHVKVKLVVFERREMH